MILFFSASVSFDTTFGERRHEPLPPPVDVGKLVDAALGDPRNWSAQLPPADASLLALRAMARSTTFEREDVQGVDVDTTLEQALLDEHIVAYRLDGALFFGAAQRFLLELAEVSDVEVVILRLGRLRVLDSTGAQALADLIGQLQHRGITVLLASVRADHHRLIERVGVVGALAHESHVVPTLQEALVHARRHHLRNRVALAAA
jgi:SulP family sulfate permease